MGGLIGDILGISFMISFIIFWIWTIYKKEEKDERHRLRKSNA